MVQENYEIACSEVLYIINNISDDEKRRIPSKFIETIKINAKKGYNPNFEPNKSLSELTLKKETKGLLALIYKNYFCNEDQEKEFNKILSENSKKIEEENRKKYNPDDIFKNNKKVVLNEGNVIKQDNNGQEEKSMIKYNKGDSIFNRIINKIKDIFKNIFRR